MKIKNLTLTFLLFSITVCSSALAIPPIPCTFFGTVSIDGNPFNGTLVTAHRSTTGEYLATAKEPLAGFGHYTIAVTAVGEYIRFKVNGVWADQPEQYCESGNFTYLDLTLSCIDCDNDSYNYTVDCNESDSSIHPGAIEACNALDDNCDGTIDNFAESCYTGPAGTLNVGICKAGSRTCTNGTWGSCVGEVLPKTEECNGLDDDCDGYVDDGVCGTTTTTTSPGGGGGGGGGGVQTTTTVATTTTTAPTGTTTTTAPPETTTTTTETTTTTQPGAGMPTSLFILMQQNPVITALGIIMLVILIILFFARRSIQKFLKKHL
jgi:hypothetical protein